MSLKIKRKTSLWIGPVTAALLLQTVFLITTRPAYARAHRDRHRSSRWGCWVDIFAGPDYASPHRRIMGPIDLANLRLSDKNWGDTITSLKTGPHTWVRVFKDTSYRGDFLTIGPGQAIRTLRPLKFKQAIDSMTVRNHPF